MFRNSKTIKPTENELAAMEAKISQGFILEIKNLKRMEQSTPDLLVDLYRIVERNLEGSKALRTYTENGTTNTLPSGDLEKNLNNVGEYIKKIAAKHDINLGQEEQKEVNNTPQNRLI